MNFTLITNYKLLFIKRCSHEQSILAIFAVEYNRRKNIDLQFGNC